ncbi:MAG: hypothetical protein IJ412_08415 [Oscillospiraceae bacterium]|nr:hypothetical protein [Oscillospiraceae bacterium]
MTEIASKKNIRAPLQWCVAAIATTIALVLYHQGGTHIWQVLFVWCAGAAGIFLPGSLILQLCRTQIQGALRFVLMCVFGMAFFVSVTVLACLTGAHWLVPALIIGTCVVWIAAKIFSSRTGKTRRTAFPALPVLVLTASVYVLLNALWSMRHTHPALAGSLIPNQDFFWNLGNVQSFLQSFPPQDLRVSGVTVTYHYLTELLQAGLVLLTGVSAYDVTAFASYAPVAVGLTGCLYGLGEQLWGAGSRRAIALSSLPVWMGCISLWKSLGAGGSRFGNMLLIHTTSNINGQATAFLFLAAFLAILLALEKTDWHTGALLPAGGILAFFLLTFSKGPQAALLSLALSAAVIVRLLSCMLTHQVRKPSAAQIVVLASICFGFWLVYTGLFSAGASSSMSLSLTGTIELNFFGSILNAGKILLGSVWPVLVPVLWLVQSFCMAPAAAAAFGLGLLQDIRRLKDLPLSALTLYAAVPGGLLAFFLFDHYSSSQIYFASIALFCLGVLFMQKLPSLWKYRGYAGRLLQFGIIVLLSLGALTALCQMTYLVRSAVTVPEEPAPTNKLPLTAAEEEGCLWLAQDMAEDALFATNRMHTGSALEGLSNVYSGLSGQQAYCESFKYAVSNMGDQTGDVMERYRLMEELFHPDTTPQRAHDICIQHGITHVLYHSSSPGSNISLQEMEPVFLSEELIIYRVS